MVDKDVYSFPKGISPKVKVMSLSSTIPTTLQGFPLYK